MNKTSDQIQENQQEAELTSFGFQRVQMDEKQAMVDDVFMNVAKKYDIMNDAMSIGLHRLWKDALITKMNPPQTSHRPFHHLDVAGGTGDVAFRAMDRSKASINTTILDINENMLEVGRARADKRADRERFDFICANAEKLPLADTSYHAYTIALGIRNVPRIPQALSEAYRVLKRGGHFLCLELTQVDLPVLDKIYDFYSFKFIPPMGRMITGDSQPYQYLVESIREFATPPQFKHMMTDAGFHRVTAQPMSGGIVTIFSGWKI